MPAMRMWGACLAATRLVAAFVESRHHTILRPGGVDGGAEPSTRPAPKPDHVRRQVIRRVKFRPVALVKQFECQVELVV